MNSPSIRVFLADDHPIVRTGIRALLSLADDIEIVGEVTDGLQVLNAAADPGWAVDVLVLDISLPRLNGIEVLRRLVASHPDLPVLFLSMYAEDQYARRLLDLGAAGYVSKDRSEDELIAAIRAVARGGVYISRRAARAPAADATQLTPRQHQIFTLLVEGRAVSDIAAQLDLAVSTVSTHVGKVKQAFGVRTIGELVAHAHRLRATSPDEP